VTAATSLAPAPVYRPVLEERDALEPDAARMYLSQLDAAVLPHVTAPCDKHAAADLPQTNHLYAEWMVALTDLGLRMPGSQAPEATSANDDRVCQDYAEMAAAARGDAIPLVPERAAFDAEVASLAKPEANLEAGAAHAHAPAWQTWSNCHCEGCHDSEALGWLENGLRLAKVRPESPAKLREPKHDRKVHLLRMVCQAWTVRLAGAHRIRHMKPSQCGPRRSAPLQPLSHTASYNVLTCCSDAPSTWRCPGEKPSL
jgi:hypothetical protein